MPIFRKVISAACIASLVIGQVASANTTDTQLFDATEALAVEFGASWSSRVQSTGVQLDELLASLAAFKAFRDKLANDGVALTASEQQELAQIGETLEAQLTAASQRFSDVATNIAVPDHLKDLVPDPQYQLRCADFLKVLSAASDGERQAILDEINECARATKAAFDRLSAYQVELETQLATIDEEIAELLDKNSLTEEEKERLQALQDQKDETTQKIDEVKEEKRKQFELQMLLALAMIVAGAALMAAGVPVGAVLIESGVTAAFAGAGKQMLDDLTEEDSTTDPANPPAEGPVQQQAADSLKEVYDNPSDETATMEDLAAREFDGQIIDSGETGTVYFTTENLGTADARIRVYSVSDNTVLYDLPLSHIAPTESGVGLLDISELSRVAFIMELQESDILAYRLTTKSAANGGDEDHVDQFLYLQLSPLVNGFVSLATFD